ncbi:tRNA (guanosine(37)-N1)-methyltransferase TrmD [Ureaplasma canigenitalium]|uniref:tRNA (guanosine(37)-N1)-methyltransferase TrmD n=1 Tax=Ureaplasma canigenitalium TaxID=42092 RepID=UPI0004E1B1A8|nr:tRNA (guanosine(37)-N1)-methyltransferase TrmD [Ureaplasma canigenitalium]
MQITIMTLFPDLLNKWKKHSIVKRAIDKKKVKIRIVDFRKFSHDKHKKVDDYPYGGSPGMVLCLEPIVECIRKYKKKNTKVYLTSPKGFVWNQNKVNQFVEEQSDIILIAGHYEGFDERIKHYIDGYVSIGDVVLSGGEIPCMLIADSIIRTLDGVISNESLRDESFNHYLLDFPVYTKPRDFEGHKVPEILFSGNHQKIDEFNYNNRIIETKKYRKDLYRKYLITKGKQ